MKKLYLVFVCFLIIMSGGCEPATDNTTKQTATTLTIGNESFSELTDIKWRGITFGDSWDPLGISTSITKTVEAGEGYIFFSRKSNPIVARTRELVIVEEGISNTFRFLDSTTIVEETNPDNTGTLRDLVSKLRTPAKPVLRVGDSSIRASWAKIDNAASYRVYCSTEATPPDTPAKTTSELTTTITGLTNDVAYYVWVQAVNSNGVSGLSEWAQGTPTTNFTASNQTAFVEAIRNINDAVEGTYTITVTGSYRIDTMAYVANQFKEGSNNKIIIKGDTVMRTISNGGNQDFITVPSGVTLELGNNITLDGNNVDGRTVVYVSNGGTFIMNDGSVIRGAWGYGVSSSGTFTMNGGTISDNRYYSFDYGGGAGGGVYIYGGTFTMNDGTISGNTAYDMGGGVLVNTGTFTMKGGTISGNSVWSNDGFGGGVCVYATGSFTKTGGTIDNTNTAVFGKVATVLGGGKVRNTTAGPTDNLNSAVAGTAGGWEP